MLKYLLLGMVGLMLTGCADQNSDTTKTHPPAQEGQTFTPGAATGGNLTGVAHAPSGSQR